MKKILLYGLFIAWSLVIIFSCAKDTGKYDYQEINEVSFVDFQTDKGYQALFGEMLTINPTLTFSKDESNDPSNYSYEWSLRLGSTAAPPLRDSIISVEKALNIKVGLTPGSYSLQYRVKDNKTGVEFQIRTTLTVSTEIYEGYLVLNEVNGQSRLDMLSYNKDAATFAQYTDVLAKQGSTVPLQGKPYQVLGMNYNTPNVVPQNYGIFLLSQSGTNRVNQETFGWNPQYNIRYLMIGDIPTEFTPERITGAYTSTVTTPVFCMYANNNMYTYSTAAGRAFKYTPVNVYSPSGAPFKVSPYVATDGTNTVMYDMDSKSFVTMPNYTTPYVNPIAANLNYPTGYDLVYMDCNYYNEAGILRQAHAILKNPATGKYYLLRFIFGQIPNYFEEIQVADFNVDSKYAFSPSEGYLFYSVGGKVYEYDLALRTSKLMINKGASQVSFLSFVHFYGRYGKPNYVDWSKWLTVGYSDPAGAAESSGVLEQYYVPPVNAPIELKNRWTGFGKIVSVAYRDR